MLKSFYQLHIKPAASLKLSLHLASTNLKKKIKSQSHYFYIKIGHTGRFPVNRASALFEFKHDWAKSQPFPVSFPLHCPSYETLYLPSPLSSRSGNIQFLNLSTLKIMPVPLSKISTIQVNPLCHFMIPLLCTFFLQMNIFVRTGKANLSYSLFTPYLLFS